MSNLLKQNSHGNNVSILIKKENGLITKFTRNKNSYFYINNELKGLNWYSKKLKESKKVFLINTYKDYVSLDINLHEGKSVFYRSYLRYTYKYLNIFIDHYIDIWDDKNNSKIHGDLTLSNILFENKKPYIIDWEHFYEGHSLWGFDLVYLVLSSLLFPQKKYSNFNKKDLLIFKELWLKLMQLNIDEELISQPLTYFRRYFKSNEFWLKILKDSPKKLYPVNISGDIADYIEVEIIKPIYSNI